jgi:hypothetical protein
MVNQEFQNFELIEMGAQMNERVSEPVNSEIQLQYLVRSKLFDYVHKEECFSLLDAVEH